MTGARSEPIAATPGDPTRALADLDAALIGLRRLWAAPPRLTDPALGQVEMSTIWVVDALDRLAYQPEVSMADLATAIDVAHSTASRLVDRAQAAGCVTRHTSTTDSRRTAVALTPTGRTLAETARRARTQYLAAITSDWAPEDHRTLADLLTRLAHAVHSDPPHAAAPSTKGAPR